LKRSVERIEAVKIFSEEQIELFARDERKGAIGISLPMIFESARGIKTPISVSTCWGIQH
jgi:hypothetical protein